MLEMTPNDGETIICVLEIASEFSVAERLNSVLVFETSEPGIV